ncbi:AAA family ATPase [Dyadobacter sp. LHD-138]|uniref:AAA family ATPase n=1 Tax=Dyadobacter sp. LHD-138 TaxID=3071413 RepID=UPI0027E117D8|nr:AAA family ATPase [Dyadobacter sp. LHD-138]MDQ6479638.1 AAA family ATPase [Dyadobacter sp. LHD-138]
MNNFISQLEIKNFKSIKELKLDCKRVNVFIGKPNVGKSNILEVMSLLNPKNLSTENSEGANIRFENFNELHYDNEEKNNVQMSIQMNSHSEYKIDLFKLMKDYSEIEKGIYLTYQDITKLKSGSDIKSNSPNERDIIKSFWHYKLSDRGMEYQKNGYSKSLFSEKQLNDLFSIKKYEFRDSADRTLETLDENFLLPLGQNLFDVVTNIESLKQKIVELFKNDYGLQFVFSKIDKKFFVQKLIDGYIYQYPYSSVADTFQRFIFYLAAIESNTNSILIFEEPEVHSFPPYVKELAERIVSKEDNQFFVSTHSPYMLQTLVEELDDTELNVVLTYYKDYQTHVKVLSAAELREVQDYSIDIFFNLNKFEPNA